MDNDNQVVKRDNPTKLFLKDTENFISDSKDLYNLDTEFEKTKKNRNLRYKIIFTTFVLLLIGISYFVAYIVEKQNRNLKVSIEEFNDVNLREILADAKKNESEKSILENQLKNLQYEMDRTIDSLKIQTLREIESVQFDSSTDSMEQKISFIRNKEFALIEKIKKEYEEKINDKKLEIESLDKELANIDQNKLNKARETEMVINSQQKITDMRLDAQRKTYETQISEIKQGNVVALRNTKNYYERRINLINRAHKKEIDELILKFNPIFQNNLIQKIADTTADFAQTDIDLFFFDDNELKINLLQADKEGILSSSDYEEITLRSTKSRMLSEYIAAIPFVNSVPLVLKHIDLNTRRVRLYYERWIKSLLENTLEKSKTIEANLSTIEKLNSQLENLESQKSAILQAIEAQSKEAFVPPQADENLVGYILDSKDIFNISFVFIDDYIPGNLKTCTIYRNSKEKIGTAVFVKKGNKFVLQQGILTNIRKPISPFDKIVVLKSEPSTNQPLE